MGAITMLAPTPPHARLSVISRHLDPRPPIPVNTPYSVERASSTQSIPAQVRRNSSSSQTSEKAAMSNQPNHPALLIPGPIEFDDAVLQSMSHYRFGPPVILLLSHSYLRISLYRD